MTFGVEITLDDEIRADEDEREFAETVARQAAIGANGDYYEVDYEFDRDG